MPLAASDCAPFDFDLNFFNMGLQIMVSPSNYNDRVHTVLDSGSVLTYMEDTALEIVHNELKQQCQQGNNPVCENATAGSQGYPVSFGNCRDVNSPCCLALGPSSLNDCACCRVGSMCLQDRPWWARQRPMWSNVAVSDSIVARFGDYAAVGEF